MDVGSATDGGGVPNTIFPTSRWHCLTILSLISSSSCGVGGSLSLGDGVLASSSAGRSFLSLSVGFSLQSKVFCSAAGKSFLSLAVSFADGPADDLTFVVLNAGGGGGGICLVFLFAAGGAVFFSACDGAAPLGMAPDAAGVAFGGTFCNLAFAAAFACLGDNADDKNSAASASNPGTLGFRAGAVIKSVLVGGGSLKSGSSFVYFDLHALRPSKYWSSNAWILFPAAFFPNLSAFESVGKMRSVISR